MVVKKTVVERVIDPYVEISEEAAHRISKRAKIGDIVSVPVETKQFGRIAAQAAKQVIIQGIREAERGMIYEENSTPKSMRSSPASSIRSTRAPAARF